MAQPPPTARRPGAISASEHAVATTQQSTYHLLHAHPDLLGHRPHRDGVVAAARRRVEYDRLAETDRPLGRERNHPEWTQQRKEGRDGQIRDADELADRAHAADERVDLLGADHRNRHDRRPMTERQAHEAAAERLQHVTLGEELREPRDALGEEPDELAVPQQALGVRPAREDAADALVEL